MLFSASTIINPCRACGITRKLHKRYHLCRKCVYNKDLRKHFRKVAPQPTNAPPGSEDKILELQWRAAHGYALHHPADVRTLEGVDPSLIDPKEDRRRNDAGETGVEKDGHLFRARPFWRGKKRCLGCFKSEKEARKVCRMFWVQELGLFYQYRRLVVKPKRRRRTTEGQPTRRRRKRVDQPTLF